MISEREKYEQFEHYLKGSLDSAAKYALEESLRKDPQLSSELEEYRQAHQLVFERGLLDVRQELTSLHTARLKRSRNWRNGRNILISAGILVTGVLLYVLLNRNGDAEQERNILNGSVAGIDSIQGTTVMESGEQTLQSTAGDNTAIPQTTADGVSLKTDGNALKSRHADGDKFMKEELANKKAIIPDGKNKETMPLDMPMTDKNNPVENKPQVSDPMDESINAPCENVLIAFEFVAENTCLNRSQGRILFLSQSLKGGRPPYEFSITGGSAFESLLLFDNLQGGRYNLVVRDADHCLSGTGVAEVGEIECDFRFAPDKGEVWEIPAINDKEGKLLIFSKEGSIRYAARIDASTDREWDGRTLNGEPLPLGVYLFRIEFDDGSRFNGTVTIIK